LPYFFGGWQLAWSESTAWECMSVFHAAILAKPTFIRKTIDAKAQSDIESLIVTSLLDLTRQSQGPEEIHLPWHCALVTIVTAWPSIFKPFWEAWLQQISTHPGSAWSMLGYLAHLVFKEEENPFRGPQYLSFRPWHHASLNPVDESWSKETCESLEAYLREAKLIEILEACEQSLGRVTWLEDLREEILTSPRIKKRSSDLVKLLASSKTEKWWPDTLIG
jgi:hypothetical protein